MLKVNVCLPFRCVDEYRDRNFEHVKKNLFKILSANPGEYDFKLYSRDDPNRNGFNKGRACNECYLESRADPNAILVFQDVDVVISPEALTKAIELANDVNGDYGYSMVVPYTRVFYMNRVWTNDYFAKLHTIDDYEATDIEFACLESASVGGCVVMKASNFEKAKGYENRFTTWGYEDSVLATCAKTLVGPIGFVDSPAVHLFHPSSYRGGRHIEAQNKGLELAKRYDAGSGNKEEVLKIINEREKCWFKNGT